MCVLEYSSVHAYSPDESTLSPVHDVYGMILVEMIYASLYSSSVNWSIFFYFYSRKIFPCDLEPAHSPAPAWDAVNDSWETHGWHKSSSGEQDALKRIEGTELRHLQTQRPIAWTHCNLRFGCKPALDIDDTEQPKIPFRLLGPFTRSRRVLHDEGSICCTED